MSTPCARAQVQPVLTDQDLERLADEAEQGFDLSTWRPRRGRPSLGTQQQGHSPRVSIRLPQDLHQRAAAKAASEGRSISAVVRSLLEAYAAKP